MPKIIKREILISSFPFLLGLMGLMFVYQQDPKRFWVLLLFFLFTGLALKIYLNERPFEPRELGLCFGGFLFMSLLCGSAWVLSICHKRLRAWIKSKAVAPTVVAILFYSGTIVDGISKLG